MEKNIKDLANRKASLSNHRPSSITDLTNRLTDTTERKKWFEDKAEEKEKYET